VVYQVRLVGLEDTWRDTAQNEARYPNLPAGSYQFEVRVKDWSGRPTQTAGLSFQVLKPWWQTWWFQGAALGMAGLVVYAGVRWRTRVMLQRMVRLEALVHERTWDLEVANEALEQASMVDPLTGLKNRRYLRLAMPELEARSIRAYHRAHAPFVKGEDLIFLMVDLDHFKRVNDTFGHAAGDAVLNQVALLLKSVCREGDIVVRWGGEEFLVVGTGADRFTAEVMAQNIVDKIRSHTFDLGEGRNIQATCSLGYSAFPLIPGDPGLLPWEGAVEAADQCLYAVKKTGRNGWLGVFRGDLEVPETLRESFPQNIPSLVAQGQLALRTSLPSDRPIRWKD
jgi:diguanylate cyclase (GGDEF)-like protein